MAYNYDDQNVFAKILRGEIPNKTVAETDHSLAFHDIRAQAPVHVLVIPKRPYVTADHFHSDASDAEILDFARLVGRLARELGVAPAGEGGGYRLIANAGDNAGQEVPHYHVHILGGSGLGPMLSGV
jgi:histidine triad (HIT) family protein